VPSAVTYSTADGTASERSDYTPARGTLLFAPGEAERRFTVLITDDVFLESPETVRLDLGSPSGAVMGATTTATLTVGSDDTADGANPVRDGSFNSQFFVRQHYLDFFGREPDAAGLAFWSNQIDECTTQACRELRRVNVSAAFFLSIEFQETGYLAYRTHGAAFGARRVGGTVPLTLAEFLPDLRRIGQGVVVGEAGWEARLEANKVAYFDEFVTRPAFRAAFDAMTSNEFVDALFQRAGVTPTQSERIALIAGLVVGAETRATVLRRVAEHDAFTGREKNAAFVLMQYFGYLRRNPSDAPELTLDFSGYNFWLTKLNSFGGNFVSAEMVKAFITSGEYQVRFGP
jgi:hypothetical protein